LARERGLSLRKVVGSGPNGRIVSGDLDISSDLHVEPTLAQISETGPLGERTPVASVSSPSAIATLVDFTAFDTLLARIVELRPEVTRDDACLKAAALALDMTNPDAARLLLVDSGKRRIFSGLRTASLGAIAAMRENAARDGSADIAVSFIRAAGIRPVAAQLADTVPMRLIVGSPGKDRAVDCLLSYDATTVSDDEAENTLAAFRGLVEAPLRLLV
jgi:hypothetical protein